VLFKLKATNQPNRVKLSRNDQNNKNSLKYLKMGISDEKSLFERNSSKRAKKKEMCFYTFRHKKSEPKFAFFIDLKR